MLSWLARRVVKDAWLVLAGWLVVVAVLAGGALTGLGSTTLFERLDPGDAAVGGSESAEGQEILATLKGDARTVSLLVTGVDISTTERQEAVAQVLAPTHKNLTALVGETNVLDPFVVPGMLAQPAAQALAGKDLDSFLIVVTVDPDGTQVISPSDAGYEEYVAERDELADRVVRRLRTVANELGEVAPQAQGTVSDEQLIHDELNDQVRRDLVHGELLTLPLALVIMVVVFGGFLLAGMPLLGALAAIGSTLGVLWLLSGSTPLMSFVVNIVTVIGLGLSIDYALLITSRFREELARLSAEAEVSARAASSPGAGSAGTGPAADPVQGRRRRLRRRMRPSALAGEAVVAAMTSAGRTVAFSGLTVAVSMIALLVMGSGVLRSIGVAGIAVVLIAVAAALTLVPAALTVLGARLTRPSWLTRVPLLGALQRRLGDVSSDHGVFSGLARLVQRVPWVVMTACVVALVVLAAPARTTHMLSSTTQLLPPDSDQRSYLAVLAEEYPAAREPQATLVAAATGQEVSTYVSERVAQVPGVTVTQTATAGQYTVVYMDLPGDGTTRADEDAVQRVRDLPAPADRWVTGQAASQLDFRLAVTRSAPLAIAVVVAATFVLLFLMTGSVLVPLKALVMNALSLAASIGVLTWVFQEGHGAGLLGFTPVGGLESYVVVTAVAVGFGLAMDYEVFLLARIKEAWDAGASNDEAVAVGLQRSGRIVTSAALVMVAVFLGFVAGDLLVIKQIGLAMAVIVAIDATIVRMLLVPATMTLLGRWNWWAPAPLRRVYERYHLTEG